MHAYFEQFGTLKHLSLIRSKKSGKPKGYAFIQFDEPAVAGVVAATMHGYPLMEKVLKSHIVPPEKVHSGMFMNADRPWKRIPWRRIVREAQRRPKTEEQVTRRIGRLLQRETTSSNKLKDLGIDYEFSNTYMKQADERELFSTSDEDDDEHEHDNDNNDDDSVSDDDDVPVPTKPLTATTKPSSVSTKGKKETETIDTSLLPPVPKSILRKSTTTISSSTTGTTAVTTSSKKDEPKKSVTMNTNTTVRTIPNVSKGSLSTVTSTVTTTDKVVPVKSTSPAVVGKKRGSEILDEEKPVNNNYVSTSIEKSTKPTTASSSMSSTASSIAKSAKVAKTTPSGTITTTTTKGTPSTTTVTKGKGTVTPSSNKEESSKEIVTMSKTETNVKGKSVVGKYKK